MGVLTMAAAENHAAAEVGHTMLRVCVRQEDAVVPVQEGVQHSGRRDEIRPPPSSNLREVSTSCTSHLKMNRKQYSGRTKYSAPAFHLCYNAKKT
jgi:hypothetical protein